MKAKLLIAAVLVMLAIASAAAQPSQLSIKGYHLGISRAVIAGDVVTSADARQISQQCWDNNRVADCAGNAKLTCAVDGQGLEKCTTIGSVKYGPAYGNLGLYFLDGKCVLIILSAPSPDDFDALVQALTVKFGKPTTVKPSQVENAMGAVFQDVTVTWERKHSAEYLSAEKYSSTINRGMVTLAEVSGAHEYLARRRLSKANAVSDSL